LFKADGKKAARRIETPQHGDFQIKPGHWRITL
jgi:hypothetical protein